MDYSARQRGSNMIIYLCCLNILSHDYSLKKKSLMNPEETTPEAEATPVVDTPATEEAPADVAAPATDAPAEEIVV